MFNGLIHFRPLSSAELLLLLVSLLLLLLLLLWLYVDRQSGRVLAEGFGTALGLEQQIQELPDVEMRL